MLAADPVATPVPVAVLGASVPPLNAAEEAIIVAGSLSACLIALTRSSVDSIDIKQVIGRGAQWLSELPPYARSVSLGVAVHLDPRSAP